MNFCHIEKKIDLERFPEASNKSFILKNNANAYTVFPHIVAAANIVCWKV
jgi:hypothetical protein